MKTKIGAVDIGSNAIRFRWAESSDQNVPIVNVFKRRYPIQLGQDVFEKGIITQDKLDQLVLALEDIQHIQNIEGVDQIRFIATSAFRELKDVVKVQEYLLDKLGVSIDVISGEEEAALVVNSLRKRGYVQKNIQTCIFDIGGGSLELTVCESKKILKQESLNYGALKWRVEGFEDDESKKRKALKKINQFFSDVEPSKKIRTCLGVGGNVRRLGRVRKEFFGKRRDHVLKYKDLLVLKSLLPHMELNSFSQKMDVKIDQILLMYPAVQIIERIVDQWGSDLVWIPEMSLSLAVLDSLQDQM